MRRSPVRSGGAGQMQGIVTDATGAPVAAATVEALQTDSGLRRDVATGQDGGTCCQFARRAYQLK